MAESYLRFVRAQGLETGRTQVWIVRSARAGDTLAVIRWFGRWRQYAFFPEDGTVFNDGCLAEVLGFIRHLMLERREEARRARA